MRFCLFVSYVIFLQLRHFQINGTYRFGVCEIASNNKCGLIYRMQTVFLTEESCSTSAIWRQRRITRTTVLYFMT